LRRRPRGFLRIRWGRQDDDGELSDGSLRSHGKLRDHLRLDGPAVQPDGSDREPYAGGERQLRSCRGTYVVLWEWLFLFVAGRDADLQLAEATDEREFGQRVFGEYDVQLSVDREQWQDSLTIRRADGRDGRLHLLFAEPVDHGGAERDVEPELLV